MRVRAPLVIPITLVVAAACNAKIEEPPPVAITDAGVDGDTSSTAPLDSGECLAAPVDGNCSPSGRCCQPISGQRFDFDRHCMQAARVALVCVAAPAAGSGGCVADDSENCWTRESDGGLEVYLAGFDYGGRADELVPGLRKCSPEVFDGIRGSKWTICP